MTRIKTHLSTFFTAIFSALLSLLGYGCSLSHDEPCMYGMPTGDFEIKGAVTTEDGNAVGNAEIRVTSRDIPSGIYSHETTTTNADGQYIVKGESYAESELKIVCIPATAELEPDSVIVKMHYNKDKNETWYVGSAEEKVDFKLTKTSEQE